VGERDRASGRYLSGVVSVPRLTVLGSLNMDISVTVSRLPGPGATALGGAAAYAPGGKGANQAVAAARLGAAVRMVGCLGDDGFGRQLRTALRDEGVADDDVRTVPGVPTGLAMITVDESGENMITVAPGANREVGTQDVAASAAPDVLVISAEIPVAAISAALAGDGRSGHDPALRILNLAPAPPQAEELLAAGPDWLVVNESEAAAVLGEEVSGIKAAGAAAERLAALGPRHVVVTAGAAGAAYFGAGAPQAAGSAAVALRPGGHAVALPGFTVTAVDSVGAGDTFVGALAVALASGCAAEEAVRAASAAGATAASRPGTQDGMPRPADIQDVTGYAWPVP
jgi:ribokinase